MIFLIGAQIHTLFFQMRFSAFLAIALVIAFAISYETDEVHSVRNISK